MASLAILISFTHAIDTRTRYDDRVDRCCAHVIRPDGVFDSFCKDCASRSTWSRPTTRSL